MARRKLIKVEVTLSVAPHVTAAQARAELRSRCNDECGYWDHIDTDMVRIRRIKPGGRVARGAS